jgi:general secretion pathway protein N
MSLPRSRLLWPAVLGAALGLGVALLAWAPAHWLTNELARATDGRLLLADARGSVWRGSAVPVLTGGVGSRDASALPGRLEWRLGLEGLTPTLRARHDCCLRGEQRLQLRFGAPGLRLELAGPGAEPGRTQPVGDWPASWLAGLGTPWNTLQPSGVIRLAHDGLALIARDGGWQLAGRAEVDLDRMAARVSPLPRLGDYRLDLVAQPDGTTSLALSTRSGALRLEGQGRLAGGALYFRGEARASTGNEAVLNNLLNIIGRRQGAVSVIAIG